MLRVETCQLLRSTQHVFERHNNRMRGGMGMGIPHSLLNSDYDPPEPIQLLIFGQGARPPPAGRRQASRQHSRATLQQPFHANLVKRRETAEQQARRLRDASMSGKCRTQL